MWPTGAIIRLTSHTLFPPTDRFLQLTGQSWRVNNTIKNRKCECLHESLLHHYWCYQKTANTSDPLSLTTRLSHIVGWQHMTLMSIYSIAVWYTAQTSLQILQLGWIDEDLSNSVFRKLWEAVSVFSDSLVVNRSGSRMLRRVFWAICSCFEFHAASEWEQQASNSWLFTSNNIQPKMLIATINNYGIPIFCWISNKSNKWVGSVDSGVSIL